MSSIFVSIANYRDFETLNTVRELLAMRSRRHEIRVGVLSQLAPEDRPLFTPLDETPEVLHMMCDARESLGACWARSTIQQQVRHEDYFLQIDSHMSGWVQDWDEVLISELSKAEETHDRAIVTAYPAGYVLREDGVRELYSRDPTRLSLRIDRGIPVGVGYHHELTGETIEEFFISANFFFSRAHVVRDVPYDPELFFLGEEITLAIRAYSTGYRMFSPSQFVMAHQYNRGENLTNRRKTFWEESEDRRRELKWWQRDMMSKWKVTHICHGEWFGKYGVRSHDLYKEFARRLRERHPDVDLRDVTPTPDIRIERLDLAKRPADDLARRPDADQTSGPADDQTRRPRVRVKALRG